MDSSPDNNGRPALPAQLHAATREQHHALNTSIMAHLPLCLPPNTNTPLLYAKGMTVFGQIYFAFEQFLETSLATTNFDPRLQEIYRQIHFPTLTRTSRLRQDIDTVKSTLGNDLARQIDQVAEQSLSFFSDIMASMSRKPHVLLSYAWAMYLALFNGGRWIHRQLASTGPAFWGNENFPLSFWDFEESNDGDRDSEGLKIQFKNAFLDASTLLTDAEMEDVIDEAKKLFDMCSKMVLHLDNTVPTQPVAQSRTLVATISGLSSSVLSVASVWGYLASSLAVLKSANKPSEERGVAMVD